jgi:molybdenum cofactor cytidylyltransferase
MPISGVLLAAGTSSRMGRNKLLLKLRGESLLHRAASAGLQAGLSPLVVVLGHESERARAELPPGCAPLVNPRYAEGMDTSLHAGIAAAQGDAAVVMLADMPLVTAEMVRAVVRRWRGEPLVVSLYGATPAPPILYSRALFAELLASMGKEVVQRHRAEAAVVAQPPEALFDLDEPADLAKL